MRSAVTATRHLTAPRAHDGARDCHLGGRRLLPYYSSAIEPQLGLHTAVSAAAAAAAAPAADAGGGDVI